MDDMLLIFDLMTALFVLSTLIGVAGMYFTVRKHKDHAKTHEKF